MVFFDFLWCVKEHSCIDAADLFRCFNLKLGENVGICWHTRVSKCLHCFCELLLAVICKVHRASKQVRVLHQGVEF